MKTTDQCQSTLGFVALLGVVALAAFVNGMERWCPQKCDAVTFAGTWGSILATLLTGGAALLAAAIGAYFLNRQTLALADQETYRRARRRQAVRATLPLSLSAITDYAINSGRNVDRLLMQCENGILPPGNLAVPELVLVPSSVLPDLKEIVEYGTDDVAEAVTALISKIQVQHSRAKGLLADAGRENGHRELAINLEEYIIDALEVYARASNLFEYARFEADTVDTKTPWAGIHSAMHIMGFHYQRHDPIRATLARRQKRGGGPETDGAEEPGADPLPA